MKLRSLFALAAFLVAMFLVAYMATPISAQEDTPTPAPTEEPDGELNPIETPDAIFDGEGNPIDLPPDGGVTLEQPTGDISINDSDITLPAGNEGVTPAEDALGWLLALGSLWVAWSLSVRMGFEKTVKPILTWGFTTFGGGVNYTARTFAIVVGVIVAAYLTAQGINVFDGAPSFIREGLSVEVEQIFTTIFLAMGAFFFHDAITWWTDDAL